MQSILADFTTTSTLHLPSADPSGKRRDLRCVFDGFGGDRLWLLVPEQVPVSIAVTVEHEDALFLGEVIRCAKEREGWRIEINVEQILSGLQSLLILRARLLGEPTPEIAPAGIRVPVAKRDSVSC